MAIPFRYNVLSLGSRPTNTISSCLLTGVVIAVFAYLQAVTDSAFNAMSATGDPLTIIVINASAETESVSTMSKDIINKLELTPGVVKGERGVLISPELVGISSAYTHESGDVMINACVRGVDWEKANQVRVGRLRILEGRVFTPGRDEVIVGESAARTFREHRVGDKVALGVAGLREFEVVGIFSTGGTSADSEIWGYVETLRDVYNVAGYSSARLRALDGESARRAIEYIEGPSLQQGADTERGYYSSMYTGQTATQVMTFAMLIILGTAAAFAIANTMYAAIAGRTREIGMLRAIGFTRANILLGFVLEGLLISLIGGVIGVVLSLYSNGMEKSILPSSFTTVSYQLSISWRIMLTSVAAALTIGFFGAVFPAWRAASLKTVVALRES